MTSKLQAARRTIEERKMAVEFQVHMASGRSDGAILPGCEKGAEFIDKEFDLLIDPVPHEGALVCADLHRFQEVTGSNPVAQTRKARRAAISSSREPPPQTRFRSRAVADVSARSPS